MPLADVELVHHSDRGEVARAEPLVLDVEHTGEEGGEGLVVSRVIRGPALSMRRPSYT